MEIKKIAVVGAGVMGTDVAFDLASHGYEVILKDIDPEILEGAKTKITKDYKFYCMMKPDVREIKLEDILAKIIFSLTYDGFDTVDLVIENINEDWNQKHKLYLEMRDHCREETYYAVNTSCISITKVAALMPKPDRVIGAHFMNPVPLKPMVETIRGFHTSDETVAMMAEFLKTVKKTAVVVNDFPGFVSNRVSHLFMNEAAFLVQDGVAGPKEVDMIFTKGFGHKMGPLATADLIGLDTVVNSLEVLYQSYQDPKFRCCPLLKKMVDAGLLGKKSGRGFFTYG